MASSDSTMVTGSPGRLPRTGDVLGERWEIRTTISSDALYATYRGTDQETDQSVLIRVVGPGRLGERDAQRMAARLRLLIGMGGPVLSPIKDADQEGGRLFVVEKFPEGASFRSVLETRRAKAQTFEPAELVPLVAHLHSALSAINTPWFHGDVRAERIYVGPDRVLLTGGFVLSVTSGDIVRDILSSDTQLRGELAPEAAEGVPGAAADRFGVALLVWEALIGERPSMDRPIVAPPSLGPLGSVLVRYLNDDPASRPASLEPLLTALAQRAKVPVPRLGKESFSVDEPPTDIDQTELAFGPDPSLGSDELGTSSSGDTPSPSDTAKHAVLDGHGKPARDLSDIDPALLAAANVSRSISDSGSFQLEDISSADELDVADTDTSKRAPAKSPTSRSSSELDPRLVRAALGVALEDSDASTNDTLPVTAKPARKIISSLPAPKRGLPAARTTGAAGSASVSLARPVPGNPVLGKPIIAKKPAGTTQEIDAADLDEVMTEKATRDVRARGEPASADASFDSAETAVGAKRLEPDGPSFPPPSAMALSASSMPPASVILASPAPAVRPSHPGPQPLPHSGPAPLAAPRSAPSALTETPVQPQPSRIPSVPPGAPRPMGNDAPTVVAPHRQVSGNLIIAVAVAVALAILGAAFWYRHIQENSARDLRIDERLRELRGGP
jgi:serine/threonine protein kinase